jgi:hypothetical protein
MEDEEFERVVAELERRCNAGIAARAKELLASIDEAQPIEVGDQHCILLGFEGNVDAVWAVPDPRPDVLLRPLQERLTASVEPLADYRGPRVALYQRVGEFTYQRDA